MKSNRTDRLVGFKKNPCKIRLPSVRGGTCDAASRSLVPRSPWTRISRLPVSRVQLCLSEHVYNKYKKLKKKKPNEKTRCRIVRKADKQIISVHRFITDRVLLNTFFYYDTVGIRRKKCTHARTYVRQSQRISGNKIVVKMGYAMYRAILYEYLRTIYCTIISLPGCVISGTWTTWNDKYIFRIFRFEKMMATKAWIFG